MGKVINIKNVTKFKFTLKLFQENQGYLCIYSDKSIIFTPDKNEAFQFETAKEAQAVMEEILKEAPCLKYNIGLSNF